MTQCENPGYFITVNPTPEEVVPLLQPVVGPLRFALEKGIAYANDLQPDPLDRDPWFWSHSARFGALKELLVAGHDADLESGWAVRPGTPNCGIHIRVGQLHTIRVVRSLGRTTPPPGRNRRRREAWNGVPVQGQLRLDRGLLCPLSLIVDWHDDENEPVIHVGLPKGEWSFENRTSPRLHWRVPMPEDGLDLSGLSFDPGDADDGSLVEIDPSEWASGDSQ